MKMMTDYDVKIKTEQEINEVKKIDPLTGLRFIFMMMIVISHLEFLGGGTSLNVYDYMFHNAKMAVDFFFMISGFGLTYKCLSTHQMSVSQISICSCIRFGWKRVKKIYPLFLVTSLLRLPHFLAITIDSGASPLMGVLKCAFEFIFASTLTQSLTGMTRFSHLFNGVGWFLSTAFVLYIIYPFIEKINLKYVRSKSLFALMITFIVGFIWRYFLFYIENITILDDLEYGSPYSRIFDFIIGIILCDLYYENKNKHVKNGTREEVIISGTVIAWWLIRNCIYNGEYEILKGIIDRIIVIGVIYIFALSSGKVSKFLSSKKMIYLGSISMYIYLIHYCIRTNAASILEKFVCSQLWFNILMIVAIVGLTTLWIYILERKRLKKLKSKIYREGNVR